VAVEYFMFMLLWIHGHESKVCERSYKKLERETECTSSSAQPTTTEEMKHADMVALVVRQREMLSRVVVLTRPFLNAQNTLLEIRENLGVRFVRTLPFS
jgi:hypothetical protein